MQQPLHSRRHQHGAALIVGLILLLVLTILAVSTMRTATLELLMASNAQYKEDAFQTAEAGIEIALDKLENGDVVLQPVLDIPQTIDAGTATPQGNQFDTSAIYLGDGLPAGASADLYEHQNYRIDAAGRTDADTVLTRRGARSFQSQGVYQLVPKSPE